MNSFSSFVITTKVYTPGMNPEHIDPSAPDMKLIKLIDGFKKPLDYFNGTWNGYARWDDYINDLTAVSRQFPDILFTIEKADETPTAHEIVWILNGKIQKEDVTEYHPPFDKTVLHEPNKPQPAPFNPKHPEMSYLDLLTELMAQIETDSCLPSIVKIQSKKTLTSLTGELMAYSG